MNGQCYPNSFELLRRLHDAGEKETDPTERAIYDDLRLVHGYITPDGGPEKGCRIAHAWVEMCGNAYDASESVDHPSVCSIPEYRARFIADRRICYTYMNAIFLSNRRRPFGPWDL